MNGNTARVYHVTTKDNVGKTTQLHVVEDTRKRKKNGEPKRTHSNHSCEDRFVDPLKSMEDIEKLSDYFQMQIDIARTPHKKKLAARNRMLFIVGINMGLRVSDIVPDKNGESGLKWKHIFEDDMQTFRERSGKREKKTGKQRNLYLNEKSKKAVMDYIRLGNPEIFSEGYVFTSSYKNPDGTPKAVTDECVSQILEKAIAACGIKGHYDTHSLRKTYAYQYYMTLVKNGEHPALAIIEVQNMLNHSSQLTTMRYLGLQQDLERDRSEMLNLG